MGWDYAYQIGDEGGSFTDIIDYCRTVRLLTEGFSGRRGRNPTIPYRDGEYSFPQKFLNAKPMLLETHLAYTDAAGAITHTNGSEGHVYENLYALKSLLGAGSNNRRYLRREDPHAGSIETLVECLPTIEALDRRYIMTWILRQLDGMWREQALQSDTEASIAAFPHAYTIATGGNYAIADAKITFTCVADGNAPSLALDVAGDTISVAGAFTAADVIVVDLARDRVITLNGDRYGAVSPNRAWYFRMPEDTAALGLTLDADSGTWTVLIEWRNKWL